jgi:hypothetical protein
VDSIVAILIAATPFIFYSYECFPDQKIWETSFFTFNSNFYESVSTFMWVFIQKFVLLYLCTIWFFTSTNWWNKSILIPIGMSIYQIVILLSDEFKIKDIFLIDKFILIPLVVLVCYLLSVLRNKLQNQALGLDLKDKIDLEIEKIKEDLIVKKND